MADEPMFPMTDEDSGLCIDRCWAQPDLAAGDFWRKDAKGNTITYASMYGPHHGLGNQPVFWDGPLLPVKYRVYYWHERPDAEKHSDDDQFHWHPDSEHETLAAAQKRLAELKGGGKKKSILKLSK